ncbi:aldo/keto reductase [Fodinicola feengrottensis]|uniref:aldo/keto reductase n=1 Tax=Fodinicola feengrottensis TaxID=435914 RepID=UPI0024431678|nr:aldo/keto reductase [Fodinicola feengrottensis]
MFVLGTMHFGTRLDERTSFELLDRFVDAGGTRIDTANCYAFWSDPSGHGGTSEALIGRWLKQRPGMRDRIQLSTKVGAEPGETGQWPANREGLSATAIKAAVEGSLGRLGVDRVEMYWTHMDDRSVSLTEVSRALNELVSAGVVGRLGASNQPAWRVEAARQVAAANNWAAYGAVQLSYSYLRPRPEALVPGNVHEHGWATYESLDHVHTEGLELWAYSPLLVGGYTRPERLPEAYEHPGTTARLAALDELASELDATRHQTVLAWLLADAAVRPIVGVSTAAQLDEAAAAVRMTLTADQFSRRLTTPA